MTDKKKKNKIADILLDFYDEYRSNEINRPMIPSIYAGKIIDSLQEEPVSEDLSDYVNELSKQFPEVSFAKLSRIAVRVANWQKEKDSILPKVWNRENLDDFSYQTAYDLSNDWAKETPTWHDVEMACKLGAKWQITKLTKDATKVTVHIDAGGYPYIPQMELYNYDKDVLLAEEGDRYKVVLIKED